MIIKSIKAFRNIFHAFLNNFYHFGFNVAFFKAVDGITYRHPLSAIYALVNEKKHKSIKKYLLKKYSPFVKNYTCDSAESSIKVANHKYINKIIWLCWWQGENALEGIAKICVNSIKENAGDCNVIFITKDNYAKYVEIPEFVIKKKDRGIISLTQFSDILRINLLNKHGGIWIDATVLITNTLPQSYFDYVFYSFKNKAVSNVFISNCRWASHFMGGEKGHVLFDFVSKLFYEYWEKEVVLIDYILIDYLIDIGYEHSDQIRKAIDDVPFNNPSKDEMAKILNECFDPAEYGMLSKNTSLFKLSRKMNYIENTNRGAITFYKYFSDKYSRE